MPTGYGIGDHWLFVIDINAESMVGCGNQQMVRPWKLNCQIPGVVEKYNTCQEELTDKHQLIEKVGRAYKAPTSEETAHLLNKVDEECTQYVNHAEHKCGKF